MPALQHTFAKTALIDDKVYGEVAIQFCWRFTHP
jgi:hypothetical protein